MNLRDFLKPFLCETPLIIKDNDKILKLSYRFYLDKAYAYNVISAYYEDESIIVEVEKDNSDIHR